jgi:hypothetical protein
VRRIDPGDQTITTVAGIGQACSQTNRACGDGGPASAALLGGPDGVWVDPTGVLWIADETRGLREVDADGTISSVGFTPGAYTVRDVVGDGSGNLYATTNNPDYLFQVTPPAPVAPVTTCQQLALAPGSLIQTAASVEIDIVDLSCQRHHVPDLATLAQIQATYNAGLVMTLTATDWQAIPASAAIPEASTDPIGFAQAMWAIFEPVCARLVLAPGDLIQASGPEVDIVTPSCQRQHVPDPATLKLIEQTYNLGITPVPDSDWQEIVGGAAIPSASTNLPGFGQAMWAIFQPECAQLTLAPGALIQATGPEVDILTPSCERQHVPDLATEQQIEQTFNVTVTQLSEADWRAIPAGSAIPSASTDLADWAQAMEQIFGSACTRLSLKSGNLIQPASGGSGIDIVGETCQRQHVPNPNTLSVIQQTYNPPSTTLSDLNLAADSGRTRHPRRWPGHARLLGRDEQYLRNIPPVDHHDKGADATRGAEHRRACHAGGAPAARAGGRRASNTGGWHRHQRLQRHGRHVLQPAVGHPGPGRHAGRRVGAGRR